MFVWDRVARTRVNYLNEPLLVRRPTPCVALFGDWFKRNGVEAYIIMASACIIIWGMCNAAALVMVVVAQYLHHLGATLPGGILLSTRDIAWCEYSEYVEQFAV